MVLLLCLGLHHRLRAQTAPEAQKDSLVTKKVKKIFLNPGLSFISNLTYAGRRDSAAIPVLLPYLNLISTKGFYLSAMAYANLASHSGSIDGFSLSPGYAFTLNKKWDGYVSATKYFLSSGSSLILSSLDASVDGGINFKPHFMQFGLSADWLIGPSQDVLSGLMIGKELDWKAGKTRSTAIKWDPNLTLTAGTQSFYQTYYQTVVTQQKVPVPGSGTPSGGGGGLGGILGSGSSGSTVPDSTLIQRTRQQQEQRQVRSFSLLNLSVAAPLNLSAGVWRIQFSPTLVFPVNGVSFNGSSTNSWVDKPFFYFSMGLGWLF